MDVFVCVRFTGTAAKAVEVEDGEGTMERPIESPLGVFIVVADATQWPSFGFVGRTATSCSRSSSRHQLLGLTPGGRIGATTGGSRPVRRPVPCCRDGQERAEQSLLFGQRQRLVDPERHIRVMR